MAAADLTCYELVELVTDYLEGALEEAERARFESHLGGCRHCVLYLEQMRHTIRELGALREDDIPWHVREELQELFREWKRGGVA